MEKNAIERLEAKSPEEAIIERISRDFNLAPFMARTQFEQMRRYFEDYYGLERDVGQMTILAVSAENPPGRPVAECERVPINLTIDSVGDLEALRQGVAALRRSKIQRLTHEAQEQGALLTQEDLARLLCTSRSTIKRDIARLRAEGVSVPTRGQIKDIGKGVSHRRQQRRPRRKIKKLPFKRMCPLPAQLGRMVHQIRIRETPVRQENDLAANHVNPYFSALYSDPAARLNFQSACAIIEWWSSAQSVCLPRRARRKRWYGGFSY